MAYKQWFERFGSVSDVGAFPKRLEALQTQWNSVPMEVRAASWQCYKDITSQRTDTWTDSGGIKFRVTQLSGTQIDYKVGVEGVSQAQLDEVAEGKKLRAEGAILPSVFDELVVSPLQSSATPFNVSGGEADSRFRALGVPPQADARPSSCSPAFDAAAIHVHDLLIEKVAGIRTKILAKGALALTAQKSAQYCGEYLNSPVLN